MFEDYARGTHKSNSLIWDLYILYTTSENTSTEYKEEVYTLDWDNLNHEEAEFVLFLMGFEYDPIFSSHGKRYFFRVTPTASFLIDTRNPLSKSMKNKLMRMYKDHMGLTDSA